MKKLLSTDPLLGAMQVLLIFMIGVLGFTAIMLAFGLPALVVFRDAVVAELTANGLAGGNDLILPIALAVAGLIALLALMIYFLILLRHIVTSVGEGDPFVPANADRLNRMGWLALAAQLVSYLIGGTILTFVLKVRDEAENVQIDNEMGFSMGGVLLILVLFVLARVFRYGATMREDLEATV